MVATSIILVVVSFIQWLPLRVAILDFGHLHKVGGLRTVGFQDPGVAPPSFIHSPDQFQPPYILADSDVEPRHGCSSSAASLCAIQHSIRLVTQAKEIACPDLTAGGSRRQAALDVVSAGNFSSLVHTAIGFDVFIVEDEDLTVVGDGLRPDLVGLPLDGYNCSGAILMPWLRGYIEWVTSWGGGFVPHFSVRLQDESTDPEKVVTYMEKCPGGADYVGVSFRRSQIQTSTSCDSSTNSFCAWDRVEAVLGKMFVEALVSHSETEMTDLWHSIIYDEKVLDTYGVMKQMSPPSNDSKYSSLRQTIDTQVANGGSVAMLGCNAADCLGLEDWVRTSGARLEEAAWQGGTIQSYEWQSEKKVSLSAGFVFNSTAYLVVSGLYHQPQDVISGPLCTSCDPNFNFGCSVANARALIAHARLEMHLSDSDWSSLTHDPWFGASHSELLASNQSQYWPTGFNVRAFTFDGLCLADGGDPANVGLSADAIFGNGEAHDGFVEAATFGGDWVPFEEHGVQRLGLVWGLGLSSGEYYIMTSFVQAHAPFQDVEDCSSEKSEDCSTWNSQVALGVAISELIQQPDEDSFAEVVRSFEEKTGFFAEDVPKKFQVHIYSSDFGCWSGAEERGITCPPHVPDDRVELIKSELAGRKSGSVSGVYDQQQQASHVFFMTWKPAGQVDWQEFYLMTSVVATPARPLCDSSAACPAHSQCATAGAGTEARCKCEEGYMENLTYGVSECGGYALSEMTCVYANGLDCTTDSTQEGEVDLTSCQPCREGYFCSDGQPTSCPEGQYCPGNTSSPISCPAGSYAPSTASSSCKLCPVGTATSWAGSVECTNCTAGTVAGSPGAVFCSMCPVGYYSEPGEESCSTCPGGSFTQKAGATSSSDCRYCRNGYYFNGGGCSSCMWGFAAPEEDATGCSLRLELQAGIGGLFVFIGIALVVRRCVRRMFRKSLNSLEEKEFASNQALATHAMDCSSEFGHPMVLMNADIFLDLSPDEINGRHTGNRDAHRLLFIDTLQSCQEFSDWGHKIVFLSYPRLSNCCRDIAEYQLVAMKQALDEVIRRNGWRRCTTHVWLDIFSVPEEHALIQQLAMDSLYLYTKCSDTFLAVCPSLFHWESHVVVGWESYQNEAMRRAEVLSFCCANGTDKVFVLDDTGVDLAPLPTLQKMTRVFDGQFTCCQVGQPSEDVSCQHRVLVTPLLGMYYDCCLPWSPDDKPSPGRDFFQNHVQPDKDTCFPSTFVFRCRTPSGGDTEEVRDLFGPLWSHLDC